MIGRNRPIGGVIGYGRNVTPGWRPKAVVQEIPATANEHNVASVMIVPPVVVVPFAVIIPERAIVRALPILGTLDLVVILKRHGLDV